MSGNPYATAAQRVAEQNRGQVAGAVTLASGTTPHQAADVIDLSRRTGAPVGAVQADPDGARAALRRQELAAAPPTVSAWATADPERYALVQDDLPSLSRFARKLPSPFVSPTHAIAFGPVHAVAALADTDPQQAGDIARAAPAGAVRQVGMVAGGFGQLYNLGLRTLDRALGLVGLDRGPRAADTLPIWMRPGDSFVGTGAAIKSGADVLDVPADRQNIATDISGAVGQLGAQIAQAVVAPQTLLPSLGAQGADVMAERAEDAGTMGELDSDLAILAGGTVTAAVERLGIGRILQRMPAHVKDSVLRRIADIAVAGGTEAATEVVEGVAQDLLTRALIDDDFEIAQGLEREAIAGGGAGAILRAIVQGVAGRRARLEARAEQTHVDTLVEAAQESKLRERNPDLLADLVDTAQPDSHVYVPLDALRGHYGDRTEAAVATLTGDPNAYAEAMAAGAEVQIPLGRYVATIGQTAHGSLRGAIRLQAGQDVKPGADPLDTQRMVADAMAEARALDTTPGAVQTDVTDAPLPPEAMAANDYQAYLAVRQAAQDAQAAARQAERVRAQERAQARRQALEWKATAAEVEAEFLGQPVYRAERLLRTGRMPDGTFSEVKPKLDRAAVVAAYGPKVADSLKGMTVQRGGLDPDSAAALLGFDSGARLVHELTTAPPLRDLVRVETDARMLAREQDADTDPDATDDGTDAMARALEVEIQAIERRNGGIRTHAAILKEAAHRLMTGKQVASIRPETYRQAEARAGREAFAAASRQNWTEAAAARRRQLQALFLYRAARDARDFATKSGRRFAQLSRKAARERIGKAGADYLDQLDAILGRFAHGPMSNRQAGERMSLAAWIKAKAEQGVIVDVPPTIADEAFRMPLRKLKLGELREVRDAVETIVHAANNANLLRLEAETVERADVDQAMAASILAHHRTRSHDSGDPTARESIRRGALEARALTATATDIARELDGFADNGAVWTHTVRVIREANAKANAEIRAAQEAFAALKLKHYPTRDIRRLKDRTFIPEVGAAWSKERMLSLALNWGNDGNRTAILEQADRRLTPAQVGAILGRLDARDWDFVEGVWQQIGRHWPDIATTQRRRTGLAPARVPPSPFVVTLPDGTQRAIAGGYYPLKYEATSVKELRIADQEAYDSMRTGRFAKAATRDGHTIERVGSGHRVVRLDLGVVMQHEREVIRDLRLGDAVNYVHNALHGPEFASAANSTGLAPLVNGLDVWLRDAATGEVGVRRWWERALRMLRKNFTASVLTYKLTSAGLQITGIGQSAVVLGKRAMLDGTMRFYRHPKREYQRVVEASEFMRQRLTTHVEAVQSVLNADAGRIASAQDAMIRHGYWMLGRVQATVDVSTWIAAERVALERGDDLATARAFADDVVSRAQASGDFIDKTAIQRGTLSEGMRQSEFIRATTVLQSYMTAKWNAAYERTAKADFRSLQGGMAWSMDMMSLFIVEGMVAAIIRGNWPDDEDDDGYLDDVAAMAAEEGLSALLGGLPGLSIASSELRGYDSKGLVAEAWEAVGRSWKQIEQGELDQAFRKAQVNLAGMAFGVPSSQLNKSLDAIEAADDGREVSPLEYLVGPPRE